MNENEFSRKGKYIIRWNTFTWDYSRENEKKIIDIFSKKYNVPKSQIKVEANTIVVDESGNEVSIKSEIIDNIQDKNFQQKLFQDYIKMNNIENINFDEILKFDNEVNDQIDYTSYEKLSKINVKWIEFKNFLSFGNELQRLDFQTLNGIVLVNSIPVNQAGKTTITSELLHFLLYGKTSKSKTMDKIFNRFLKSETEVIVRGCLGINGEDYIIERILTRPKKRTKTSKTTSSLKYYKVIDKTWNPDEPLTEYDPSTFNNQSEDVTKTNKIIKESLMKEMDFELISVADSKTLDALIDTSETNLSKIFSRFLGINVIEDKENIAKGIWKDKSGKLLSNQYNTETLQNDIIENKRKIENSNSIILSIKEKLSTCDGNIIRYNSEKDNILSTKGKIDETLVKLDIHTQETLRNNLIEKGKNLRAEQNSYTEKVNELVNINVDKNLVENNRRTILGLTSEIATIKNEIKNLQNVNLQLNNSRVCPTCKREYDPQTIYNIEQSISENTGKINVLIEQGVEKNTIKQNIEAQNIILEEQLKKIDERNKYELKLAQVNINIANTTNEYLKVDQLINNYQSNRDAIARNNQIDIAISNINIKITTEQQLRDSLLREVAQEETNIKQLENIIKNNEDIIGKLYIENEFVRHYKLYLNLLSKDGIKKIVLRNVLPIINSSLNNLLGDLVDFSIEVQISDKNDIGFFIIKESENGESEYGDLISSSGYERTMSALALRTVLSKYSSIPTLNFILFDEVTARTGDSNFPSLFEMFKRIESSYQFIFVISHSTEFNQYFENIITITNENNVSKIKKQ
jgi:DNA repair exonuclease SbcCD ATPase subunit